MITRQPYPQFDPGIFTALNDGSSSYNALSVKVERRYSNGLYFLGNYQFSKNIDNNSGETDNAIAYRMNTSLNRARSAFDQRSRGVVSGGYELPFGTGKRYLNGSRLSDLAIGGWQLQGIFSALTGMPFTPTGPFVCSCGSYIPQWVNAVKPGFGQIPIRRRIGGTTPRPLRFRRSGFRGRLAAT